MGIVRDEVIPTLTVIGDLVSVLGGTQQSVDSVVRALSQMASKGKLSQEEILQLAEALPGFNANAALAAELGMPVADVLDLISSGGLDATTGINALLAGMAKFPGAAGAMEAQSKTLLGVFSTFKDTISIALSNAFQPVIPEIKSALADLTPILGGAIGQLAPSLGKLLSGLLPLIGKIVEALVPVLGPILDALGPALEAIAPALVPLGEAFGQLITALVPILPVLTEFVVVLAQLAVPILKLLAAVITPLAPIFNFMARAIGELSKALDMIDWTAVGAAITGFLSDIGTKIADFFAGIFRWFAEIGQRNLATWKAFVQVIQERVGAVIDFVRSIPGRIGDALGNLATLLVTKGKDLIRGLWDGISGMAGWLYGKVKTFISENVTGAFKNLLGIHSPSTVAAEEIGKPFAQGIGVGVESGIPDLAALISGIVPTGAGSAATSPVSLGNIIVNVSFSGVVPTQAEAQRTGQAAGAGIAEALQRRGVALAVRTA